MTTNSRPKQKSNHSPSPSRRKITFIGGGSNAWVPNIVKDMMLTESLQDWDFCLYDIDKKASDMNKVFLTKLAKQMGVKAKFTSTDKRARAFDGADYFVIVISTGGLKSMAHDLAIPEEYGIYHTVGDTSGPGGWARLIRNFDVCINLARDIKRYAPGAMVLNYTNPMATLTDVLSRIHNGPVVGLCHGLFENLELIKHRYNLESEDDISVRYGGINHFFWMTQVQAGGKDVLADLKSRLKSGRNIMREKGSDPDVMGFSSSGDVATELFRLTGVMPYIGDRHTCEFFPWLITNKKTMKKYNIVRTTIARRKELFRERRQKLKSLIRGEIDKWWFTRSRETACDIINAHATSHPFVDVGNLPNTGQISNLAHGAVVETAVQVDSSGFTPIHFGQLPEPIVTWIGPWTVVYKMVVDACLEGDLDKALLALRMDPICAQLPTPKVEEMGRRLLRSHKRFIKAF